MTERCATCGGERRVYSCWDEAKCPMARDGACAARAFMEKHG